MKGVPAGKPSDWYVDRLEELSVLTETLEDLCQTLEQSKNGVITELNKLDEEMNAIIHQMRKEGFA